MSCCRMIIQSRDAYAATNPLVMMPHSPQPPLTVPPECRKWTICGAAWPQLMTEAEEIFRSVVQGRLLVMGEIIGYCGGDQRQCR